MNVQHSTGSKRSYTSLSSNTKEKTLKQKDVKRNLWNFLTGRSSFSISGGTYILRKLVTKSSRNAQSRNVTYLSSSLKVLRNSQPNALGAAVIVLTSCRIELAGRLRFFNHTRHGVNPWLSKSVAKPTLTADTKARR